MVKNLGSLINMTEEEAAERWCPFARVKSLPGTKALSINRDNDGMPNPATLCIASRCMAWRHLSPLTPEDGYCGLAGRPDRIVPRSEDPQ